MIVSSFCCTFVYDDEKWMEIGRNSLVGLEVIFLSENDMYSRMRTLLIFSLVPFFVVA